MDGRQVTGGRTMDDGQCVNIIVHFTLRLRCIQTTDTMWYDIVQI